MVCLLRKIFCLNWQKIFRDMIIKRENTEWHSTHDLLDERGGRGNTLMMATQFCPEFRTATDKKWEIWIVWESKCHSLRWDFLNSEHGSMARMWQHYVFCLKAKSHFWRSLSRNVSHLQYNFYSNIVTIQRNNTFAALRIHDTRTSNGCKQQCAFSQDCLTWHGDLIDN